LSVVSNGTAITITDTPANATISSVASVIPQ
jgi:hypothetical protein